MLRATLTRRYAAKGKDLMFGTDARQKMLDGVARLSKAVGVTLGPKGRNVIIEQSYGAPKITKDGVTVAKAIEFKDPFENLGAQLVRQVASVTNDVAGDGTTTSTILANAIFQEGFKCVQQGVSPVEVKRGIDHAVKIVVQSLTAQTKPIVDKNEITQVATISANGDAAIGQLIAAAMEKVGKDGVITTADGKTLETELEVVEGMSIDRGFISPYFITNSKTQKVEFEDCLVLCSLKKISTIQQLLPVLNLAVPQNKPLLIVADDIDGEALSVLILNKLQGKLRVCAVKAPGFGDNKTNSMQDIGVFVGGQVVSEEGGISLEDPPKDILGYAKKVTVTKESTILLHGGGNKAAVDERVELIKELLNGTESEYEKEKLQDRLAKLSGGVAMIRVGGASELEVQERKDRVTDALMATRAAVAEGIVAGGGAALLHASKQLEPLLTSTLLSADMRRGIQIVYQAIRLPAQHIADNAGKCGAVIVDKILQEKDSARGYDAANDTYVNMFDAGIVDPTKVVRVALVDASSVAGLMITTECAITDTPQPPAPAGGGGGGGMGGMGGMGGDMF